MRLTQIRDGVWLDLARIERAECCGGATGYAEDIVILLFLPGPMPPHGVSRKYADRVLHRLKVLTGEEVDVSTVEEGPETTFIPILPENR